LETDKAGSSDTDKDIDTGTDTNTDRGHDEDCAAASGSPVHIWSRPQDTWNYGHIHLFIGDISGSRGTSF